MCVLLCVTRCNSKPPHIQRVKEGVKIKKEIKKECFTLLLRQGREEGSREMTSTCVKVSDFLKLLKCVATNRQLVTPAVYVTTAVELRQKC